MTIVKMKLKKKIRETLIATAYPLLKRLLNANPTPPIDARSITWGTHDFENVNIPNIIWTYWSGTPSACADACLESLKRECKNFNIIDLNERNIIDYLPDLPKFNNDLPLQSISDFIRLSLLEKYGGIWIDRSVIVTCNFMWAIDAAKKCNAEVLCFYNHHPKSYRISHEKPIVETGFITASKNSRFIKDWLNNFKQCILSDNWKTHYQNKNDYPDLVSNFVNPPSNFAEYFSVYIAAQETMENPHRYKLFLMNAEDDYYFYYYKTCPPFNRINFSHWILATPHKGNAPKLTKLPKRYREMTDIFISLGYVNKRSLLGKNL
jgi:hypothetical protein